ncbi:hypothetical protein Tco_1520049 [Tanacetum coccineum]
MTSSNNTMHNDIIAIGSKEHLPILALEALTDGDNPTQESITKEETYENTSPEKPALVDAEAKAVHMILNGIGNDIYSTVDAGLNDKEMWIEIERLQQGESINI